MNRSQTLPAPAATKAGASVNPWWRFWAAKDCTLQICSFSIGKRLAQKLALLTFLVIGSLSVASWLTVKMLIDEKSRDDLKARAELIADIIKLEAKSGGEISVVQRMQSNAAMRDSTRLQLWTADGQPVYDDAALGVRPMSEHQRSVEFVVDTPGVCNGSIRGLYTMDYVADARLGDQWMVVLTVVTLLSTALVALGTRWHVRRQLRQLDDLAAQTRAISASDMGHRLAVDDPAEELLPWVVQFNALMDRLEMAYAQLEGFNADVAHELRTPIATLIGETELALSRERSPQALRDTLVSNLEEMQRLSAMVNDMLFLSHADRGAMARRGDLVSLADLAQQVAEFHEAPMEDAQLQLQVHGDAQLRVDEALVKRALSNLIGNATRYARQGSTVQVKIEVRDEQRVDVEVLNQGEPIPPTVLPRLFDRFFRADTSRNCADCEQHHGLGLAIVAGIARMHAGSTWADSSQGVTRIGFSLAKAV